VISSITLSIFDATENILYVSSRNFELPWTFMKTTTLWQPHAGMVVQLRIRKPPPFEESNLQGRKESGWITFRIILMEFLQERIRSYRAPAIIFSWRQETAKWCGARLRNFTEDEYEQILILEIRLNGKLNIFDMASKSLVVLNDKSKILIYQRTEPIW